MQQGTAPAKKAPAPQRQTISLEKPEDVRYWTQALNLSEEKLRLLVRMHGTNVQPIYAALNKKHAA
jgi:hypothetical protein